jgi:hypothetical protein
VPCAGQESVGAALDVPPPGPLTSRRIVLASTQRILCVHALSDGPTDPGPSDWRTGSNGLDRNDAGGGAVHDSSGCRHVGCTTCGGQFGTKTSPKNTASLVQGSSFSAGGPRRFPGQPGARRGLCGPRPSSHDEIIGSSLILLLLSGQHTHGSVRRLWARDGAPNATELQILRGVKGLAEVFDFFRSAKRIVLVFVGKDVAGSVKSCAVSGQEPAPSCSPVQMPESA